MTTFNGAAFLRESIDSILAQAFSDFELVVVDDCSTDETAALLASYAEPRLRVYRTPRNLGVVGARNYGVAKLRGAYLAMLDHDDLSTRDRLATQAPYLDANPRVVLVGSEIRISADGALRRDEDESCPTPLLARFLLHVDNPLTWSSVMLRASALDRLGAFVRPEFEFADDFDLYHRLLSVGEIVRLPLPLTVYRDHGRNTSYTQRGRLTESAASVLARVYRPWFDAGTDEAAQLAARHLAGREPVRDTATLDRLGIILARVLEGFCAAHEPDAATVAEIEAVAARLWWRQARAVLRAGHPSALRVHRNRRELLKEFAPGAGDMLASLMVAGARATAVGRRLLSALRP